MTTATFILIIIAVALFVYAWLRGDGSHKEGLKQSWQTLRRTAALLIIAFVIVGYISLLSPTNLIDTWIGPNSGWGGLFIAEAVGMLLPGGPYVVFPLISVLYKAGAGLGPTVTMVTSWATLAFLTLTFELPFMGWRFMAIRWGLGLVVPLFAGAIAHLLF
jgi:uncharacterized membrane protein YraQ (UPF0718 family)